MDWRGACIVTLYKKKGDNCVATREVLVRSVVGKLYAIVKELGPELNVSLGRVEDALTKCLQYGRSVKNIWQMGKMYAGHLWIGKGI